MRDRQRDIDRYKKVVAIVGTLDTKGIEFKFLKEQIEAYNVATIVINVGILGKPFFNPDVSAAEVAKAAGEDLQQLIKEEDRGHSIAVMCRGAAAVVEDLYRKGKFHGLISMGGGAGTNIGTAAMRSLPIGVPKLMVSTLASGDTRPYVGSKDITMMPSIVDISGINRFSRQILANAAGAIAGMVKVEVGTKAHEKPMIAATMFGVTTPCVTRAREILEAMGYEVLVFHANGIGGRSMEELTRSGLFEGVLDITTTELADEMVGGIRTAGANRLEAAGEIGIPQVVSAGALDMVNFGPPETVPAKFKGRQFYKHTPTTTLMRTTKEENERLGKIIAEKLNQAKGPVTFIMPQEGVSSIDRKGQPFYDAEADTALLKSLKNTLADKVKLVEMDTDINDPQFAARAVNLLLESLTKTDRRQKS